MRSSHCYWRTSSVTTAKMVYPGVSLGFVLQQDPIAIYKATRACCLPLSHFDFSLVAPSCLRPSWSVGHQCSRCHTTPFPLKECPPSSCERPSSLSREKARAGDVREWCRAVIIYYISYIQLVVQIRVGLVLTGQHVVSAVYVCQDSVLTGVGNRQLVSSALSECWCCV